eukprot:7591380-Heterocapsa_arctica.AAC.1
MSVYGRRAGRRCMMWRLSRSSAARCASRGGQRSRAKWSTTSDHPIHVPTATVFEMNSENSFRVSCVG